MRTAPDFVTPFQEKKLCAKYWLPSATAEEKDFPFVAPGHFNEWISWFKSVVGDSFDFDLSSSLGMGTVATFFCKEEETLVSVICCSGWDVEGIDSNDLGLENGDEEIVISLRVMVSIAITASRPI